MLFHLFSHLKDPVPAWVFIVFVVLDAEWKVKMILEKRRLRELRQHLVGKVLPL